MIRLLELTLPTAAENLALDEALLESVNAAESAADSRGGDVLRLWEPSQPMVVVGRASKIAHEVNLPLCAANQTPVLRRCSGGASVVALPGCLMYAVVLSLHRHPELRMIEKAHRYVLHSIRNGLQQAGIEVEMQGTSDLTIGNRKFSGNSLRCKRNAILYHGTILCNADLDVICRYLRTAPRQPEYRQGRGHEEFVTNLGVATATVRPSLIDVWNVDGRLEDWPTETTRQFVAERYSQETWNYRI